MPIFAKWSGGVHYELDFVVKLFDQIADNLDEHREALEAFRDILLGPLAPDPPDDSDPLLEPSRLIGALLTLTESTVGWEPAFDEMKAESEARGETFKFESLSIDRDWFLAVDNMWRFDSELSPRQMHQIMRRTGAEMAQLVLDGSRPTGMMTQCNHNRMRVAIHNSRESKSFNVWVFVPANSGWMGEKEFAVEGADIDEELKKVAAQWPRDKDYRPGSADRRRLLNDIDGVVSRGHEAYLPYRNQGVPFNWGGGYESPPPEPGQVVVNRFTNKRQPGEDQMPADADRPTGPLGDGCEVVWRQEALLSSFPIRWYPDPDRAIPEDLAGELHQVQANILRPHYREAVSHLLVTVGAEPSELRELLGTEEFELATAFDELEHYRMGQRDLPAIVLCAISSTGFEALDLARPAHVDGAAFIDGMKARQGADARWAYEHDIHLLLTVAGSAAGVETKVATLVGELEGVGCTVVVERGSRDDPDKPPTSAAAPASIAGQPNQPGHDFSRRRFARTVEPFGNIDGISNPWFFACDALRSHPNGADQWYEGASPKIALVGHEGRGYGSFLVFQKLEQDQAAYEEKVNQLAELHGLDVAGAEAALVGRRADGSPTHRSGVGDGPQFNDFRWPEDGEQPTTGEPTAVDARLPTPHVWLMNERNPGSAAIVRRGVPYWPANSSDRTKGLLFAAYTNSIDTQFLPIERRGREGNDVFVPSAGNEVVTLLGGEYLYVPPPSFFDRPSSAS